MGRINPHRIAKYLKSFGIDAWFGILKEVIVASGKTKPELEQNLNKILSPKETPLVYILHIK